MNDQRKLCAPFAGYGQVVRTRSPDGREREHAIQPGLPGPFDLVIGTDPTTGHQTQVVRLGAQWVDAGWEVVDSTPAPPRAPTPAPSRPVADLSPDDQAAAREAARGAAPPQPAVSEE